MKGIVKAITNDKSRVAALTEYGFIVFDCNENEFMLEDIISGNLDDHGEHLVTNQTSGHRFCVVIEAIQADWSFARSLLISKAGR